MHRLQRLRRLRCRRLLRLQLAAVPPVAAAPKRPKAQGGHLGLSDFGTGGPQRHMPRQGPARRRHSFGSA